MNDKKKIIIPILSLMLCILVTFGWINELQNMQGRVLTLKFNEASVATSELEVKLSVNVEEDVFEDITKVPDQSAEKELASYDDFAPGSRKRFKVEITNLSTSPITLRMILSDIICENEELRESIIIGTNGYEGFNSEYPAPAVQNKRLCDGISDYGGFVLIDNVEIPPDNAEQPVSIYFYVIFSASGSADLENMTFSIGEINFMTI